MTKPHEDDTQIRSTYLGDGLYAENDGFSIRLYTQSGNNVWLEPEVWDKLRDWVEASR
jgi:hypothetical protein